MHLHPAIVSLPEEDSAPDTPNPNNVRTLTLFASIHKYIEIVIPFPILDGQCFHAKAEQHYISTSTAHYYYTSTRPCLCLVQHNPRYSFTVQQWGM